MLIATPLDGAHYFVDLLGGAVVAVIALALSSRLVVRDAPATQVSSRMAAQTRAASESRAPA